MRQWRVGTFSMGLSLIAMGIVLLLSQWNGSMKVMDYIIMWWPLIFILLGLEIIFYLFVHRKENPIVKYDAFSVIIVGVLGTVCILFTAVSGSGIMHELRYVLQTEEHTVDLPHLKQPVPADVKRIVLQTSGYLNNVVQAEGSNMREVHLFGNIQYVASSVTEEDKKPPEFDMATIEQVGDTLYVTIKQPSRKLGLVREHADVRLTVVLPKDIEVQMRQGGNGIDWDREGLPNWKAR